MNPARLNITESIEALAKQNSQKVNGQEVPQFKNELKDVRLQTCESLVDCCFD